MEYIISMHTSKAMYKNFLFLDTETTDATDEARLVQLAVALNQGPIEVSYYKPAKPITIGAMATHHITNEMVESYHSFVPRIAWVNRVKQCIIVAHNAPFDLRVLENEGVDLKGVDYIDTLAVAKHVLNPAPERYSLQFLRYYLNLDRHLPADMEIVPHDAVSDVLILRLLTRELTCMVAKLLNLDPLSDDRPDSMKDTNEDYDIIAKQMIKLSTLPITLDKVSFGKYKGDSFESVAINDYQYLVWCSKQEFCESDKDLKHTINLYLDAHDPKKPLPGQTSLMDKTTV